MQTTSIDELLAKLNIPASDQAQIIGAYGNLDPDICATVYLDTYTI